MPDVGVIMLFVLGIVVALIGSILSFLHLRVNSIERDLKDLIVKFMKEFSVINSKSDETARIISRDYRELLDKTTESFKQSLTASSDKLWEAVKENELRGNEFRERMVALMASKPDKKDIEIAVRSVLIELSDGLEYKQRFSSHKRLTDDD